jgi:phosphate starvation-inducible PhoH-like protein
LRQAIANAQNKSISLSFDDNSLIPYLFGEHNNHLRHLEKALSLDIVSRGNTVAVQGLPNNVDLAQEILEMLWEKISRKQEVTTNEIDAALRFMKQSKESNSNSSDNTVLYDENAGIKTFKNKLISPRSPNQQKYIKAIRNNDMVFGIGPAGTGKTYLAVAAAVAMYKEGLIERMVFCRPAVEAGEQLGFLPGDMLEKIDPYLRPIYDALHDMMPSEEIPKKIERGDIEIAPLAFMRGRTLKNAFVVLDEAQNTTSMQMKMFLTRMGEGTRMVVTGDPSQIDLPPGTQSGLKEAMSILSHIEEVPFIHFDAKDVVRHKLVTKIIEAYDKHDFRSRS